MNKLKYILSLLVVTAIMTACDDDNNYVIGTNTAEFGVNPVAIPAVAEGGSYELTINGTGEWTIELTGSNSLAAGWCTVSKMSGHGHEVVRVNILPSTSLTKNREVIINVTSGGKTMKSKVLQAPMTLGETEVLINGMVWSTVNLDGPGEFVDAPDKIGKLYQFNRNVPYEYSKTKPANWPSGYSDDGTDWTAENDPCPEGWRIPTTAEMAALWEIGATWVAKSQTGFSRDGIIVGIDPETAKTATKDNLKALGGLFLPQSGWLNGDGNLDRDWLVAVRSATSLSVTHGGMSLGDAGGYRDIWGWGDGQKERAAMIRPVKIIQVED